MGGQTAALVFTAAMVAAARHQEGPCLGGHVMPCAGKPMAQEDEAVPACARYFPVKDTESSDFGVLHFGSCGRSWVGGGVPAYKGCFYGPFKQSEHFMKVLEFINETTFDADADNRKFQNMTYVCAEQAEPDKGVEPVTGCVCTNQKRGRCNEAPISAKNSWQWAPEFFSMQASEIAKAIEPIKVTPNYLEFPLPAENHVSISGTNEGKKACPTKVSMKQECAEWDDLSSEQKEYYDYSYNDNAHGEDWYTGALTAAFQEALGASGAESKCGDPAWCWELKGTATTRIGGKDYLFTLSFSSCSDLLKARDSPPWLFLPPPEVVDQVIGPCGALEPGHSKDLTLDYSKGTKLQLRVPGGVLNLGPTEGLRLRCSAPEPAPRPSAAALPHLAVFTLLLLYVSVP